MYAKGPRTQMCKPCIGGWTHRPAVYVPCGMGVWPSAEQDAVAHWIIAKPMPLVLTLSSSSPCPCLTPPTWRAALTIPLAMTSHFMMPPTHAHQGSIEVRHMEGSRVKGIRHGSEDALSWPMPY